VFRRETYMILQLCRVHPCNDPTTTLNHKDLAVVWLDIVNAYGSIPNQLIQVVMHQYYIPDHSSNLIMNYFNNNHFRFSSSRFTTTSFKKGCFIFAKLFVMV